MPVPGQPKPTVWILNTLIMEERFLSCRISSTAKLTDWCRPLKITKEPTTSTLTRENGAGKHELIDSQGWKARDENISLKSITTGLETSHSRQLVDLAMCTLL